MGAKTHDEDEAIPPMVAPLTYFVYGLLAVFGYVRDFFGHIFKPEKYRTTPGFAPLLSDFENFFTRRMFHRIQDCWNRPIASRPGAWIDLMERTSDDYNRHMKVTSNKLRCLNLGSYNYLGFADQHKQCTDDVVASIRQYGPSTCAPRLSGGTSKIHVELEAAVARYVGKETAIVYGMGFATNSMTLPALLGKGSLVVSDSLNHSSLVTGARASGARIRVFQHNDMENLERVLRESIAEGQPRTHRPWRKIVVLVEGIYSMEGDVCNLPEIVRIKNKYRCYLYMDEAHSIGAMGKTGRGIVEYFGLHASSVDVLMGTFTKSFGSCGGYVASSHAVIDYLRSRSAGLTCTTAMAPGCAQQALTALQIMMGDGGTTEGVERLKRLHENANYFRNRVRELGFKVVGYADSPVVPVLLYNPAKVAAFSREAVKRGMAVVVAGFPATHLLKARVRFCLSAAHTREMLDWALPRLSEIGDVVGVKYQRPGYNWLSWLLCRKNPAASAPPPTGIAPFASG
jgi:serine palmitoyltransferase